MPSSKKESILLDTHAWVWTVNGDKRAEALREWRGQNVLISAISVWELAMLVSKKRLELQPNLQTWIGTWLRPPFEVLPLEVPISLLSCELPGTFHGDPADRMIMATAMSRNLCLATADEKMLKYAKKHRVKVLALE